jgi:hypothetical protein
MWSELKNELDHWAQYNMCATFWWRDDDAIDDTKELDNLLDCAGGTPVALAVIPDLAGRSLARRVLRAPSVSVLQHGWRHENHTTEGAKSEYPVGRDPAAVAQEFSFGSRKLTDLFGQQYLPVFAPPWHGFDDGYLPLLSQAGLQAVSRKGARHSSMMFDLVVSNVHCVPIRWGTPPSFGSDDEYLSVLLDHLRGRRDGTLDPSEPTGVLTHHLVQNTQSYAFMAQLVSMVAAHPAGRWLSARQVFGL